MGNHRLYPAHTLSTPFLLNTGHSVAPCHGVWVRDPVCEPVARIVVSSAENVGFRRLVFAYIVG